MGCPKVPWSWLPAQAALPDTLVRIQWSLAELALAFLSPPAIPDAETTAMAWPNLATAPATSQRQAVPAPKEGPVIAQLETSTGTGSPGELESLRSCYLPMPWFPCLPQGRAGVTACPHRAWCSTGAAGPGAGVQHPPRHAGRAQRAGP